MSFSDLLKSVEHDLTDVLLPRDQPSDTREAAAIAKATEGVAVTVDPELAPMFDRLGVLGDYIEQALHEFGTVAGTIKSTIAKRAQSVPPPDSPAPVASEPSDSATPTGETSTDPSPSTAGASTETTGGAPVDSADGSTTPSTEATSSMSNILPPVSTADTTSTPPADPTTPDTPTSTPTPTSEPTPVQTDELAAQQTPSPF